MTPLAYAKIVVLLLAFIGGSIVQRGCSAEKIGGLETKIATLEGERDAARRSAKAKGDALAVLDAENKRRVKEAEESAKRAETAEKIAAEAKRQLDARGRDFEKKLNAAASKSPSCAALLSADINKVCNL